jgi:hypothetical protein
LKNINFCHPYTPAELEEINQELAKLLLSEAPDEKSLYQICELRDEFIQRYLLTLEGADKKLFCEEELKINKLLVTRSQELYDASLSQLSGLIRGRKAVKKYY